MKQQHSLSLLFTFLALFSLMTSCKKEENIIAPPSNSLNIAGGPSLSTAEATSITSTSALLGGEIIHTGACHIIEHGFVLSTDINPTTDDKKFIDTLIGGTGSFSQSAVPLLPSTTYYARAFATNCKGTNYGNEIHFTTLGGGGTVGNDTGWFRLTISGTTYFAYDLFHPLSQTTVFPEGDTRFAMNTWDSAQSVFSIASQSSFLLDGSRSFGYSFAYLNHDVTGTGTYSFGKFSTSPHRSITSTLRTGPGSSDFVMNPSFNGYGSYGNYERHTEPGGNCKETELTSGINILIITRWGNPGEFIEGTLTGTIYEYYKCVYNCQTTPSGLPYTVEFKLKRYQ